MDAIVLRVCQHKSAQTFLLRSTHLRMVVTTVATALMVILSVMMARNVTVLYEILVVIVCDVIMRVIICAKYLYRGPYMY